ncbi:MAG: hypothetical protein HZC28_17360 [Spirochaetes bacterium]|nr:hypothetical protein [Spirochaetota bacterium]
MSRIHYAQPLTAARIIAVSVLAAAVFPALLCAQFDLSFLPSYECHIRKCTGVSGTFLTTNHISRSGSNVTIVTSNTAGSRISVLCTDGRPLSFRSYGTNGAAEDSYTFDWNAKQILLESADGKTTKRSFGLRERTICAPMITEVFRGFPWDKNSSGDFVLFTPEKGNGSFDAVLSMVRSNVALQTPGGTRTANVLKLSAGIGFIKFEQKYEFIYAADNTHELIRYEGVDASDRPFTSALETMSRR